MLVCLKVELNLIYDCRVPGPLTVIPTKVGPDKAECPQLLASLDPLFQGDDKR